MSAVYFTTQHEGEARLRGSERAWMGMLCTKLAASVVPDWADRLAPRLTPDAPLRHWLHGDNAQVLPRWIETYLGTGDGTAQFVDHDGTVLETFALVLNTALVLGSGPVALMARLHASCEIHCYVEGPNRAWMADLIEQGRATGVMRGDQGWEAVAALLRNQDDQPVVCHYSVTARFPNAAIAEWEAPPSEDDPDEPNWDAWYDLADDEQWTRALAGLRGRGGGVGLELRPDHLRCPYGHARSLLDLFHRQPAGTPA